MAPSRLINRNITAGNGRTSMRLEPELWDALEQIARETGDTLGGLIRRAEENKHEGGRTSAVRVFVVQYFRAAACAHSSVAAAAEVASAGQRRRTTGPSGAKA